MNEPLSGTNDSREGNVDSKNGDRYFPSEDHLDGEFVDPSLEGTKFAGELHLALHALLGSSPAGPGSLGVTGRPNNIGEFRIIREIARGGMGVVYEAIQESLGRRVALKLLPVQMSFDLTLVKRFELESRSAAKMHHSNIVPVFSVGIADGIHYYAMQYIAGCSLSSIIHEMRRVLDRDATKRIDTTAVSDFTQPQHGDVTQCDTVGGNQLLSSVISHVFDVPLAKPLEGVDDTQTMAVKGDTETGVPYPATNGAVEKDQTSQTALHSASKTRWLAIARIGAQAASALSYSAKQGILHRDVKPSNLLLDESGNIWLTDFGLAKAEGEHDLTRPGDVVGTLRYMPPERLNGTADERGDLYGLGVTLYELLLLRPAYSSRDRSKLLKQIENINPIAPRTIDRSIPIDLETIILKLMAKAPKDRYANGEHAAADFQAFLEQRPISARRLGHIERVWRWCGKNPGLACASTAALLMTFGLIATLWLSNSAIQIESHQKDLALNEKVLALQQKEEALKESRWANELSDRRYYAAQINLAGHAFEEGDLVRVRESLHQFKPARGKSDLREFSWNYLNRMIHSKIECEFSTSGGRVRGLDFSSDANRILVSTASPENGRVVEYDLSNLAAPMIYGDGREFLGAEYLGDDQIVGVADDIVLLWNRGNAKPIQEIRIDKHTQCFLVTNDKRWLLIGGESGSLLPISTHDWRPHPPLQLHATQLTSLSQPHDSTLVYTCNRWHAAPETCVLETANSEIIRQHKWPSKYIAAVGGSPTRLAGLTWGDIDLIDPQTLLPQIQTTISHGQIFQLKYSANGEFLLVTAGMERKGYVLSASDLSVVASCAHSAATLCVAVDVMNRRWASGDVTGQVVVCRDPYFQPPDLRVHIPEDSSLFLYEKRLAVSNNESTLTADPQQLQDHATKLSLRNCRGFSADRRYALTSETSRYCKSDKDTITVWDLQQNRIQSRIEKSTDQKYLTVALSPDATYVAIQVEDQPIELWNIVGAEPKLAHHLLDQKALCLEFSPDGKWIAGAGDASSVTVWEVKSGKSLGKLLQFPNVDGHAERVRFSPDSRYVAAGSSAGEIYVYDMLKRNRVGQLLGHLGEVSALEFFPDGRHLVAGGVGRTRIYDFQLNQEILSLPNDDHKVGDIVVSPDGQWLATLTREGTLRVFNGANGDRE